MDRVLALTSPHMVDIEGSTEIADAQALLAQNQYGNFAPYGDHSQSGEFGDTTAGACHRAKFWLGFPPGHTTGTFGRPLKHYLTEGGLPPLYKARRLFRINRAKRAKKQRALQLAISQIGKKEYPPGSNRVLYSTWYGMIGSWCAMFQTWVGVQIGEEGFARGARWAYVPYLDNAASEHRYNMSFISWSAVEPGDLVTYDWEGNGVSDHIGRFEKWIVRGQTFYSIEGNTAVGNDSNGGEVMRRERDMSLVHHMIHLED